VSESYKKLIFLKGSFANIKNLSNSEPVANYGECCIKSGSELKRKGE